MGMLASLSSKLACRMIAGAYQLALPSFPPVVRVETTNRCNARCIICPHSQMSRHVRTMTEELYLRVIDECAEHPGTEVHLHNFGEPLLDKALPERIRYAKSKCIRKVTIFSNGSLMDEPRARALIDAGLDEIKLSIDGATREEFERIRYPLKFDRVIDNIRRLTELRDELGSALKVVVTCCSTTDKSATMRSLESVVDGFSFTRIHNWGGGSCAAGGEPLGIRKPCSRLWRTFTVLANGDVALCCLDYDGQHLLGHLNEDTSIRAVWHGAVFAEVRRQHLQARHAETPLCSDCSKSFLFGGNTVAEGTQNLQTTSTRPSRHRAAA